ncbi:MAG: ArsR/SmtB family transcription factor [Candidatus Heimdallarchaeota archaeon]
MHDKQIEFLKLFADQTRHRILDILTKQAPQNPAELAEHLNLARPGIEKHLKLLKEFQLIEREIKSWPTIRYVYTISHHGDGFLDRLIELLNGYFAENQVKIVQLVESLEESFILGEISRTQYNEQTEELKRIQQRFEGVLPIHDYLDEALRIREELES